MRYIETAYCSPAIALKLAGYAVGLSTEQEAALSELLTSLPPGGIWRNLTPLSVWVHSIEYYLPGKGE